MNPTKLTLTNFGPIEHAELDLEGFDLAAVVGPNGTGKSTAFTIAPVWALFGTTKNGCSVDSLIRLGADTGSVSFEFEHRGARYRVVRTRSIGGRGKSSLELQRMADGAWMPFSGTTIKETEEKIQDLLGLDSDTLISSSMILQGRANEFTQKSPGERKYILAQILGLDDYEVLQGKAKERVAELSRKIEDLKAEIARHEETASWRGQYEELLGQADEQMEKAKRWIEADEAKLKELRQEIAKLDNIDSDYQKLKDKAFGIERKISGTKAQVREEEAAIEECSRFLGHGPVILQECEAIGRAEKELFALQPYLERQEGLKVEKTGLMSNRGQDDRTLSILAKETEELEKFLSLKSNYLRAEGQYKEISEELEAAEAQMVEKFRAEREIAALEREIIKLQAQLSSKRDRLTGEIETLKKKAEILSNAGCVNIEAARQNPCLFLQDATEAVRRLPELEKELSELSDAEIKVFEAKMAKMKAEIPAVRSTEEVQGLKNQKEWLREVSDKARLVPEKEKMLRMYEDQMAQKKQSIKNCEERIAAIDAELEKILASLANVEALKARVAVADKWRSEKDKLPAMEERLKVAVAQVKRLTAEIESLTAEHQEATEEIRRLKDLIGNDVLKRSEAKDLENNIAAQNKMLQNEAGRIAVIREKLKEIEAAEFDVKRKTYRLLPLADDFESFSLLVKAFGRDGIPALIIESAVPELEIIANEILGAMSGGRHSLEFRTQRELKSRSGMAETLDIIVRDWAGERPYETFSGGEQLRIDYAIRFALAELLTRKAGSHIEWLVIDEGLGSQDKEHRDLVLEAIRNVAGRFKKVFVITHVEEAQGAFQQQIRFENTQNGIEIFRQ